MTRYNHFKEPKYEPISFKSVEIGQTFRMSKWKGKTRRYLMCKKTGDFGYMEVKSGKEHTLYGNEFTVYKHEPPKTV